MRISIDGRLFDDPHDARVSVLDHGLLYGDGVFEGLRIYARRVFRLEDHLRRLAASARAIHLAIPGGIAAARAAVLDTAAAAGVADGYVRLVVTRGEGALGVDPASCARARIVCIVDDVELFPEALALRGLDVVTASVRRPAADVLDPRVKSLNYLNSVLAKAEARRRGADDALVLNAAGAVAEASAANVFVLRHGWLSTPPATDGALEGITRATVLELAAELGLPARERTLGRLDVLDADEAFLTGTGARVAPIRSLDGEPIGGGVPGEVTLRLRRRYLEHARSRGTPIGTGCETAA
jgi:branched-chain amino acid aminotransferase